MQGLSKLPRLASSWMPTCLTLWQVPPCLLALVHSSCANVWGGGCTCMCAYVYACTHVCVYIEARDQLQCPSSGAIHFVCVCMRSCCVHVCICIYICVYTCLCMKIRGQFSVFFNCCLPFFFLDNGLSGNLRLTKELAGLRDPLVPDPPILELEGRACLALPLWVLAFMHAR